MKISIIIPVFNEEKYILKVLKNVNFFKKELNLEIIVSDDGSNDDTLSLLKKNEDLYDTLVEGKENKGKGSAIINALKFINGDYVIIQDADLEYNPEDYFKLIDPINKFGAEVIFGSRFKGSDAKRILYFKNRVANFILSFMVSLLTNINFSDVETGYKVIKSNIFKELNLKENSFAIEIEMVMKLAKKKFKILRGWY